MWSWPVGVFRPPLSSQLKLKPNDAGPLNPGCRAAIVRRRGPCTPSAPEPGCRRRRPTGIARARADVGRSSLCPPKPPGAASRVDAVRGVGGLSILRSLRLGGVRMLSHRRVVRHPRVAHGDDACRESVAVAVSPPALPRHHTITDSHADRRQTGPRSPHAVPPNPLARLLAPGHRRRSGPTLPTGSGEPLVRKKPPFTGHGENPDSANSRRGGAETRSKPVHTPPAWAAK